MKQYGVTKLEAIRDLQKEVANCDKIINEESLKNIDVPLQNRKLVFKILRMLNVSYNEGEGFTFTKGKIDKYIASLFVNRICLWGNWNIVLLKRCDLFFSFFFKRCDLCSLFLLNQRSFGIFEITKLQCPRNVECMLWSR